MVSREHGQGVESYEDEALSFLFVSFSVGLLVFPNRSSVHIFVLITRLFFTNLAAMLIQLNNCTEMPNKGP